MTSRFLGDFDSGITYLHDALDVVMMEDAASLDEVVVIGYGQMRRANVTAAISSIDGEELQTVASSNHMSALSGRISGISIQKSSGLAGADVAVKIRGVNTFGSNTPLYIIDGFPGDIGTVNPADIESMQVLKDGAASAIYGSQAANGSLIQPNAKAGDIKFVDSTIDDSDRYDMGSGIASLEASFTLGLAWRNFDFSALIGSSWGADIYNGNRLYLHRLQRE